MVIIISMFVTYKLVKQKLPRILRKRELLSYCRRRHHQPRLGHENFIVPAQERAEENPIYRDK